MERRPGRDSRPAYSTRRRTWYGWGQTARIEKSGFGRLLHDCPRIYADVSVSSLPFLLYVFFYGDTAVFGVTTATLVTWATMVVSGTLIRGGWIDPLGTDLLGWVSITPWLILFRLGYFNGLMMLAVFGSLSIAAATSVAFISVPIAVAIAYVGTSIFPACAEIFYKSVR